MTAQFWQAASMTASRHRLASRVMIILAAALLPRATGAIDAKCNACDAVVVELFVRLNKEVPRNHLDLRHRLDKDGKRWGPLIEYRVSELRMIELLEDLCTQLEEYVYEDADATHPEGIWRKVSQKTNQSAADLARSKHQTKQLVNYCHSLIESQEDQIVAAIRGNSNEKILRHSLCQQWTDACKGDASASGQIREEL